MGQNSKKQIQLQRMFKRQGGRCNWCGRGMMPPGSHKGKGKPHPLLCTYDHLDCRLSDDRGKHSGEYRNVAACWTCNNNRAIMQQANVSKELLWKKSGAYPLEMRAAISSGQRADGKTLAPGIDEYIEDNGQ